MSESQLIEYKESWRDEYPNEQILSLERALQKTGAAAQKRFAIFAKNTESPSLNIQCIQMTL